MTARSQKQADVAYSKLRRRILENRMPAGTQALEAELATLLGMSRTPVREAMIRLQQEGLVEVRPRHGMRVLAIEAEDMREIYQILTSLESTAAGLIAARGLTDREDDALNSVIDDMEASLEADDLTAWANADRHFHHLLVKFCGNRRLAEIADNFMDQSHRARLVTLRLREKPQRSASDHRELMALMRAGEVEQASAFHIRHREGIAETLVDLLEGLGLQ